MKKAIYCILAVFMLLVVSFASASTYTVRPSLNNNTDIEEQIAIEKEPLLSDVHIYGHVRENYYGSARHFPNVTITAFHPGPIPYDPWLLGRFEASTLSYLRDENGYMKAYFSLHIPPGYYIFYAQKDGYKTLDPSYYRRTIKGWIKVYWYGPLNTVGNSMYWEAGESCHYYFTLTKGSDSNPSTMQSVNTFQQILINLGK